MSMPENFQPADDPFLLDNEPSLSSSKSSVRKRSNSDSAVVWSMVLLLGLAASGYALVHAARREPAAVPSAPAPVVVVDPVPPPRPPAPARRTRTTPAAPTPAKAAAPAKTPAPIVTVQNEAERKVVDPIEGFESGEAFDNPPSPGRYGQRTSGLMERSTPAARPNAPDPSFGRNPR